MIGAGGAAPGGTICATTAGAQHSATESSIERVAKASTRLLLVRQSGVLARISVTRSPFFHSISLHFQSTQPVEVPAFARCGIYTRPERTIVVRVLIILQYHRPRLAEPAAIRTNDLHFRTSQKADIPVRPACLQLSDCAPVLYVQPLVFVNANCGIPATDASRKHMKTPAIDAIPNQPRRPFRPSAIQKSLFKQPPSARLWLQRRKIVTICIL